MEITRPQQLLILFVVFWPAVMGFHYPSPDCVNGVPLRKVSGFQNNPCELVWNDQNKEQIQDVYKRFLFHYSKSQDTIQSMQSESHSAHPLMRLSPKLSHRRKKQFILSNPRVLSQDVKE